MQPIFQWTGKWGVNPVATLSSGFQKDTTRCVYLKELTFNLFHIQSSCKMYPILIDRGTRGWKKCTIQWFFTVNRIEVGFLCTRSNSISTTANLQPSEPSLNPLLGAAPSGDETWRPLKPNPKFPGFTAPLASFFREEREGSDFAAGPLPPLDEEEREGGSFKKLQAETIRNAQLAPVSTASPPPRSKTTPPPSTLSFPPQSGPTPHPTPSPIYYKPLPPSESHFKGVPASVRSQFRPLSDEEPGRPEETFEPRQEDIDLDSGIEFDEDGSETRIPVGFTSHNGFKIPDFFRNFLSAPPVWIKDKL